MKKTKTNLWPPRAWADQTCAALQRLFPLSCVKRDIGVSNAQPALYAATPSAGLSHGPPAARGPPEGQPDRTPTLTQAPSSQKKRKKKLTPANGPR